MDHTNFIAKITLPDIMDLSFISTLPKNREWVNKNMEQGIIQSYSMALDRSHVWVIFQAETMEEAWNLINEMPISQFIEKHKVQIHGLAFCDLPPPKLLMFGLN